VGNTDYLKTRLCEEILKIKDESLKFIVQKSLDRIPPYFWTMSSSSTGKHHPKDEFAEAGEILHTLRVCKIADLIMESHPQFINQDIVKAACILHDGARLGLDWNEPADHTVDEHPMLMADLFYIVAEEVGYTFAEDVRHAIEAHTGKWGDIQPHSLEAMVVHFADSIAAKYYMNELEEIDENK
jgi:23S rRNA maturation-related 3'-5' exoribonuclease YhaM